MTDGKKERQKGKKEDCSQKKEGKKITLQIMKQG